MLIIKQLEDVLNYIKLRYLQDNELVERCEFLFGGTLSVKIIRPEKPTKESTKKPRKTDEEFITLLDGLKKYGVIYKRGVKKINFKKGVDETLLTNEEALEQGKIVNNQYLFYLSIDEDVLTPEMITDAQQWVEDYHFCEDFKELKHECVYMLHGLNDEERNEKAKEFPQCAECVCDLNGLK